MNKAPLNTPDSGEQGLLFTGEVKHQGTDPNDPVAEHFIEPPKGEGVFSSDNAPKGTELSPADAEFAAKAHTAYLEDQAGPDEVRQLSQKGKHNPFSRAKKYGSKDYHEFVKIGDADPRYSGVFIKNERQLDQARKYLKDKYGQQK